MYCRSTIADDAGQGDEERSVLFFGDERRERTQDGDEKSAAVDLAFWKAHDCENLMLEPKRYHCECGRGWDGLLNY